MINTIEDDIERLLPLDPELPQKRNWCQRSVRYIKRCPKDHADCLCPTVYFVSAYAIATLLLGAAFALYIFKYESKHFSL